MFIGISWANPQQRHVGAPRVFCAMARKLSCAHDRGPALGTLEEFAERLLGRLGCSILLFLNRLSQASLDFAFCFKISVGFIMFFDVFCSYFVWVYHIM